MKNNSQYKRLPGRTMRSFGFAVERERIFLAPDHLLSVQQHGYTEKSRRFYFKDIQLITLHETPWMRNLNLIIGLIALAFFGLAYLVGQGSFGEAVGSGIIFTILALMIILPNWVLGSTAATFISTRAQTHRIACLGRLRTARKVVALLQQEIDRVQGISEPQTAPEPVSEPALPEPLEQYHE